MTDTAGTTTSGNSKQDTTDPSVRLQQAICTADPYRRQGTLYIHTTAKQQEQQQQHSNQDDTGSNGTRTTTTTTSATGELVVPISLSTTFRQVVPGQATAVCDYNSWNAGYEYARTGNPTRGALERALAQAEGQANYAVAFSSGSAAVSAVLQACLLLATPTNDNTTTTTTYSSSPS